MYYIKYILLVSIALINNSFATNEFFEEDYASQQEDVGDYAPASAHDAILNDINALKIALANQLLKNPNHQIREEFHELSKRNPRDTENANVVYKAKAIEYQKLLKRLELIIL